MGVPTRIGTTTTRTIVHNSYYDFDNDEENDFFLKDLKSMSKEELEKYNAKYEGARTVKANQSLNNKQFIGQIGLKTWNFLKAQTFKVIDEIRMDPADRRRRNEERIMERKRIETEKKLEAYRLNRIKKEKAQARYESFQRTKDQVY